MKSESGFTLVEAMVVMALAAILMTLGAGALRTFWLTQALEGAHDGAMTQLRAQQERVVSESHPLVFGARFRVGSSDWDLVEYDPSTNVCSRTRAMKFENGVQVSAASFLETGTMAPILAECRGDLGVPSSDKFVMFFARGTASSGSLTLTQPSLGRSRSLSVKPITGRVQSP